MSYKQFTFSSVEKQKISDMEHKVVISTDNPDRYSDVVVSEGIQYDNYLKNNPVVLFQHGHDFQVGSAPIARAKSLRTYRHKVESSFEFARDDQHAERIENLWSTGFLNAASIGALVLEAEDMEVKDKDDLFSMLFPPQKITRCELLEYSLVTLPANQQALRKELDIQLMKLLEIIEQKLAPVETILQKAQDIDAKIELLKHIEGKEHTQIEGFVPYVQYQYSDEPWDASFIKDATDDISFIYAYATFAPHHIVKEGSIVTSKDALVLGFALINGFIKDIEGSLEAYQHLAKHYAELSRTAPDYAYKQWAPLQTVSYLRSEKICEDQILLTLTSCGIELSEALKYVKVAESAKEKSYSSTSDEYDEFLAQILKSCKSIVDSVNI